MTVYVIATAHPEYARKQFPPGSVVVDPWRMVRPQQGVELIAVGCNRPETISLLLPSRGRPEQFKRMLDSALETATYPRQLEVVCYLDHDDPQLADYVDQSAQFIIGPRILLSKAWNLCCEQAQGQILMHCGDDIVFQTPGWDQLVREEFARSDDKILLVQGDDLSPNREVLATHGFLHRRWVEKVGYFLPPLFSCDWNDVWLTEVADMIGRRVLLPFITVHQHYTFGLRERDQTDLEREQRGRDDDVAGLYQRTLRDRQNDAAKLKAALR